MLMEIDSPDLMEDIQALGQAAAQYDIPAHAGTGSNANRTDREGKKPSHVVVDETHPFDLDAYVAGYSGKHFLI